MQSAIPLAMCAYLRDIEEMDTEYTDHTDHTDKKMIFEYWKIYDSPRLINKIKSVPQSFYFFSA
jgi:hypothetical protein